MYFTTRAKHTATAARLRWNSRTHKERSSLCIWNIALLNQTQSSRFRFSSLTKKIRASIIIVRGDMSSRVFAKVDLFVLVGLLWSHIDRKWWGQIFPPMTHILGHFLLRVVRARYLLKAGLSVRPSHSWSTPNRFQISKHIWTTRYSDSSSFFCHQML